MWDRHAYVLSFPCSTCSGSVNTTAAQLCFCLCESSVTMGVSTETVISAIISCHFIKGNVLSVFLLHSRGCRGQRHSSDVRKGIQMLLNVPLLDFFVTLSLANKGASRGCWSLAVSIWSWGKLRKFHILLPCEATITNYAEAMLTHSSQTSLNQKTHELKDSKHACGLCFTASLFALWYIHGLIHKIEA